MPRAPAPDRPEDADLALARLSYEEALAELEALVAGLESGQWPLDRMLQAYQRGARLLQHCRDRLQAVEQQVQVLEDGPLRPWTSA